MPPVFGVGLGAPRTWLKELRSQAKEQVNRHEATGKGNQCRHRQRKGKRTRHSKRKAADDTIEKIPDSAKAEDKSWEAFGYWVIDTFNPNAWASASATGSTPQKLITLQYRK